jgi:HD-GYP domain-containing protein (c-di-GMP phosphodiesterase class II)
MRTGEGEEVPLGARIVAVADSFDAMTTDRPYRKGMPPWQAAEEIVANAGKQFDPLVVDAFKRVIFAKIEGI